MALSTVWIWLGVLILSVIIEACTMELTTVWFAIGAVVAIILSVIPGIPWWVELIVFCALSIALLLGLRKFAVKYLLKGKGLKTNVDSLTDKVVEAVTPTGEELATVKMNGVVWNAVTEDGSFIKEGEKLVVIRVDGNKLVVKKQEETKA